MTSVVVEPVGPEGREPTPDLPVGEIQAEPVPDALRKQPVPLVRLLMPIIMIAAVVGMVALMVMGGGDGRSVSPMLLMFPLMMLASVFMMFSPQGQGQDPDETRRTYLRHLKAVREEALENARAQRAHEFHRHPNPDGLIDLVGTARLWERDAADADALEVRLGVGETALCTPIAVPDPGATEDLDPVCAVSLRHLVNAVDSVPEVPVALQLRAFRFIGFSGKNAQSLARALVAQLVVAHGPETVGIEIEGADNGEGWEWLKWLPHARNPRRASYCVLIVNNVPTSGVEDFIEDPELTTIIDVGTVANTELGMRAEMEGMTFTVGDTLNAVTADGEEPLARPDGLTLGAAQALARRLARCTRPRGSTADSRSKGDLLSLLGVEDIDQLSGYKLWPGRAGSQRLSVPLGIDPQGQPVILDLKEAAQGGMGPHGLAVGATGSGKSEILREIVVGLAATHSPEELNFVLVDFKGGATFLGCDVLPHTSAVITNLEEESTLVARMFDAISGELTRRQEVLRKAGNFANVTEYSAARAVRDDLAPLPALVIVVDEFSELLAQHPDFADLFVAVGRLGRSLHVHLLLASQRLEEGRLRGLDSHLSYRIGLKTFSAGESRQVLGVTDAYHLPSQPGAGYLKTDAEDIRRFQAAYVSGPLERPATSAIGAGRELAVQPFTQWKDDAPVAASADVVIDKSTTLFAAVVEAARAEAKTRDQRAHQIWLPPLPDAVELPAIIADSHLTLGNEANEPVRLAVPLGLIDRPFHQRQDPLFVDLGASGGHAVICGGPQSGKSTAVRTMVASIAALNSPDKVRFYIIDAGGGQLSGMEMLPHVAGVANRTEPDKVRRIVDEVMSFAETPQERHTFLVIDGWHHIGTGSSEFEDLAEPITKLAADGPSARVHLIITTPRWTTMRPSIRDLVTHRLELRLGEAMDSLVDRKAQAQLPAKPGRGLTPEAQFMLIANSSNQDVAYLAQFYAEHQPVPALRTLPEHINRDELAALSAGLERAGLAWGIGGRNLEPVTWDSAAHSHFVCVGSSGSGKSEFLATVGAAISDLPRADARMVVIDHRRSHLARFPEEMVAAYSATAAGTEKALQDAAATLRGRLPGPEVSPAELKARSWWEGPEIYILIDDLDLVSDMHLGPLVELIPHARDVGMHVVATRKSGGIARAMYGGFMAALRDSQPAALLLDAEKDEGTIFGIRPTHQPPGRGTYVVRGESQGLARVARSASNESAGE